MGNEPFDLIKHLPQLPTELYTPPKTEEPSPQGSQGEEREESDEDMPVKRRPKHFRDRAVKRQRLG